MSRPIEERERRCFYVDVIGVRTFESIKRECVMVGIKFEGHFFGFTGHRQGHVFLTYDYVNCAWFA